MAGIHGTVSLFDNQIPELWEEFHRFNKKYLKTAGAVYSICETKQTTYTKDGNISFTVIVVKNWMARRNFEVYEREIRSFDDPDNQVKIYIPIK